CRRPFRGRAGDGPPAEGAQGRRGRRPDDRSGNSSLRVTRRNVTPKTAWKWTMTEAFTSSRSTGCPRHFSMDVMIPPSWPHGRILRNSRRSVVTLWAKPWNVTFRWTASPIDAIFLPPTQTPRSGPSRVASIPKSAHVRRRTSSRSVTSRFTSSRSGSLRIGVGSPSVVVSMGSAVQHVDRLAEGGLRALHDRLRQRRVGMDGEGDVGEGRTHLDRQGELADQVARIRTDDRRTEEDLRVG